MLIDVLNIRHFRCLEDVEIRLGPYVAVIGANGVGKSTVIEALRFVLDPSYRAEASDLNKCSPEQPLHVAVRCIALNAMERTAWGPHLAPDGSLQIARKATAAHVAGPPVYLARGLRHAGFAALHEAYGGNLNSFRAEYNRFRTANPRYNLPNRTTASEQMAELLAWEADNPDECEPKDTVLDKSLLTKLEDAFRIVHVPAVSPVEDAIEGKRSSLDELVNQVAWGDVVGKPDFVALQSEVEERYRKIFVTDGPVVELQRATNLINDKLKDFAPGSSVDLTWNADTLPKITPPGYRVVVTEDGSTDDVARKGTGVQRALLVALVNAVADNDAAQQPVEDGENIGPTTLLLVEEPELYLHPTRARHFAKSLAALANVDGDRPRRQILATTHSPHFATVSTFESIRLLRRDRDDTRTSPRRLVSQTTLETIWTEVRLSKGYAEGSEAAMKARSRLSAVFDDVSIREAFFADAVVLLEGASDEAAITAELRRRGTDLDTRGIAVARPGGHGELDKLWFSFRSLDIPTFLLFDGDWKGQVVPEVAERNKRLLQLVGATAEDYPITRIDARYGVFHVNLETTLREEFGLDYDRLMAKHCADAGLHRREGQKNVSVVREIYDDLHRAGKSSPTLTAICDSILALVP